MRSISLTWVVAALMLPCTAGCGLSHQPASNDAGTDASPAHDSAAVPDARADDASDARDAAPPCRDGDGDGAPDERCGGDDCDDASAAIGPRTLESCDGVDQDCDGAVDEGATVTVYSDRDEDGFGDDARAIDACGPAAGLVLEHGDCNDRDATVHPGQTDACNARDDDCDGSVDEDAFCLIGTVRPCGSDVGMCQSGIQRCGETCTFGACEGAIEPADERCGMGDEDCDGSIDEGC